MLYEYGDIVKKRLYWASIVCDSLYRFARLLLSEGVVDGDAYDPHDFTMQAELAQIDVNRPNFATHLL